MKPSGPSCPQCGIALAPDAPQRLCPACLLQAEPSPDATTLPEQATLDSGTATVAESRGSGTVRFSSHSERPGETIGRYRLLSVLGEGGMGTVYLAEQHEPVSRRVALKVIKLGMDTRQVVARFEVERQALAVMDHPGIAKVFDAGATDNGRPFFVMELVEGVPLTKFCDAQRLGVVARLRLFIQVCHALHHAHQKGIIHRDLKPSNILVTLQDGQPVPKVIDFGVAKATGGNLGDATLTQANAFLGTPSYASPEQAGAMPDVDTRSDVYTLGVILYELLTGQLPLDSDTLRKAAVDEVLRRIREEDPPKPSTRVAALASANQTTIADLRRTQTTRLAKALRGDLDWVVMKALEKNRSRRYESASALAQDVERHLANEAVVACPPSAGYLLKKLLWRHRVAFAAGSTVAASLIAGFVVSVWQAGVARDAESSAKTSESRAKSDRDKAIAEKERADSESAIAKAVSSFLRNDILKQAGSEAQTESGALADPNLTVRAALDRAAGKIGDRFKEQPMVEAAIRETMGRAYLDLGEGRLAVPHFERAVILRREKYGPEHTNTLAMVDILASAYAAADRHEDALKLHEATFQTLKAKHGADHEDTLASMNNLATAYEKSSRSTKAIELYEEGLKLTIARYGPDYYSITSVMNNLAMAYRRAGRRTDAVALLEKVLTAEKLKLGPDHPDTLRAMHNLALCFSEMGRGPEAVTLHEEALKRKQARLGTEHLETLTTMNALAMSYLRAGRVTNAVSLLEETLRLRRVKLGSEHSHTLVSMDSLVDAYRAARRFEDAIPLSEEILKTETAKLGPDHPSTLMSMHNLAVVYHSAGRRAEGVKLLEETLRLQKVRSDSDDPGILNTIEALVQCLQSAGRMAEALPHLEELLQFRKAKLGPEHPRTLGAMNDLGVAYQAAKRLPEAGKLLEETVRLRKVVLGADHPHTHTSMNNIGMLYLLSARPSDAEAVLREAVDGARKAAKDNPDLSLATYLHHLADALVRQMKLPEARSLAEESAKLYDQNPAWSAREAVHAWQVLAAVQAAQGDSAGAALSRQKAAERQTQPAPPAKSAPKQK